LPPSEIGEHKGEHPLFQPRSAIGLEGEFEQHLVPARAEPDFLRRTAGEIFVEEEIFVAHERFAAIVEARRRDEAVVEPNLGLMVKCTPERGHNALFFIPLEVIIML